LNAADRRPPTIIVVVVDHVTMHDLNMTEQRVELPY
jgi:hypothetical protein